MALDPLQGCLPVREALPQKRMVRKERGASAFAALLAAAGAGRAGGGGTLQQAAEALRIEMMQQSLSVFAAGEAPQASTLRALEAMLASQPGQAHAPAAARQFPAGSAAPGGAGDPGAIEETASRFLGTPYRFGGEGGDGIDCSGFVQQVFREHRIELPRTAREQRMVGAEVAQQDLRKGDLVFFERHVGIYLGEGKMIHASSVKGAVTVSDINSDYYRSRYLGARRIA